MYILRSRILSIDIYYFSIIISKSAWFAKSNYRAGYSSHTDFVKMMMMKITNLHSHQVFIRELISNASDALEKLRYLQMTGVEIVEAERPLEIHIATDDDKKTFTIQVMVKHTLYNCIRKLRCRYAVLLVWLQLCVCVYI